MTYRIRLTLFITAAGFFSCWNKSSHTPERNFYFEIKVNRQDSLARNLERYLIEEIPQKKYTITHESANVWPYYAALDLHESINPDSLVPPHWFVHKMIFRDSLLLNSDDRLVIIHVMPKMDTALNYRVQVFNVESGGLRSTADTGIHFVDSAAFRSPRALMDYYLKSVVLSSFK
jgi:hypothetical protein